MTAAAHNESRGTPVCGVSLTAVVLENGGAVILEEEKGCPRMEEQLSSKRKEGYQYFGVQSQFFPSSAFRLMNFAWSLSCCFLRGASSPNSSTSLLTIRRTGR